MASGTRITTSNLNRALERCPQKVLGFSKHLVSQPARRRLAAWRHCAYNSAPHCRQSAAAAAAAAAGAQGWVGAPWLGACPGRRNPQTQKHRTLMRRCATVGCLGGGTKTARHLISSYQNTRKCTSLPSTHLSVLGDSSNAPGTVDDEADFGVKQIFSFLRELLCAPLQSFFANLDLFFSLRVRLRAQPHVPHTQNSRFWCDNESAPGGRLRPGSVISPQSHTSCLVMSSVMLIPAVRRACTCTGALGEDDRAVVEEVQAFVLAGGAPHAHTHARGRPDAHVRRDAHAHADP